MGVPKFYRWLSERYPCLSEVITESQVPEFDCLYLDMNGIIHVCSHPHDDDPLFRITEEEIFVSIFAYIEALFRLVKPRKVFYMAIDGVAPRAKMNQQRSRRFRTAKEAEMQEKKLMATAESLPATERFDSNAITPGTKFMSRLHEELKYFTSKKVHSDRLWRDVKVILSGHDVPGEGEHKIMDFIRYERSQPNYSPTTRHCLYGLDADLIHLGLTSHEPYFSLLREEVRFDRKRNNNRANRVEEQTFHLLHLSLLRDYLDIEFSCLKEKLTNFDYDLEAIIDDWILMGFLVGNDFIPHLPNLHISKNAFPILINCYCRVLPLLDGYINNSGTLNLERFEVFCKHLTKFDEDFFEDYYSDMKWMESKRLGKEIALHHSKYRDIRLRTPANLEEEICEEIKSDDDDDDDMYTDVSDSEVETVRNNGFNPMMEMEYKQWKRNYYIEKFEISQPTEEFLMEQTATFVRALQWNLHYYYNGIQSWSWFYPFHYAPFISDFTPNFSEIDMSFELSKPFKPFEQLLAVLPARSRDCLPSVYHNLMCSPSSPVIDFYPTEFSTDLNGKTQDWEAVVLIPFIDENRLLEAMRPLNGMLTFEESERNTFGQHLVFTRQPSSKYTLSKTAYFPAIPFCTAHSDRLISNHWRLPLEKIRKGILPNVRLDAYLEGFPSMRHLNFETRFEMAGVKVFQSSSRGENAVITLLMDDTDFTSLKNDILSTTVFVKWPYMKEAKVIAICNGYIRFFLNEKGELSCEDLTPELKRKWHNDISLFTEELYSTRGVEIGPTFITVEVNHLVGRKFIYGNSKVSNEKQYSTKIAVYPLQTCVRNVEVIPKTVRPVSSLSDLFPASSIVFNLSHLYYGAMGVVQSTDPGVVHVRLTDCVEPDLSFCRNNVIQSTDYFSTARAAQMLGISSHLLGRITGSLYFVRIPRIQDDGKSEYVNLGLSLKYNRSREELPGYTKWTTGGWTYSNESLRCITDYLTTYPELFDYISGHLSDDKFYAPEVFGINHSEALEEIQSYIKHLPSSSIQRVSSDLNFVEEQNIHKIEEAVRLVKAKNEKRERKFVANVKPNYLFRVMDADGSLMPDPLTTFELYDRVVNVREGYCVPLGLRGTIISLGKKELSLCDVCDVLFDEEFTGATTNRKSKQSVCRVPFYSLINISFGGRNASAVKSKRNMKRMEDLSANTSQSYHIMTRPNSLLQTTSQSEHNDETFANLFRQLQASGEQSLKPKKDECDIGSCIAKPSEASLKDLLLQGPTSSENKQIEIETSLKSVLGIFSVENDVSEAESQPHESQLIIPDEAKRHSQSYLQLSLECEKSKEIPPSIAFEHLSAGVVCMLTFARKLEMRSDVCRTSLEALENASLKSLKNLSSFVSPVKPTQSRMRIPRFAFQRMELNTSQAISSTAFNSAVPPTPRQILSSQGTQQSSTLPDVVSATQLSIKADNKSRRIRKNCKLGISFQ